MTQEEPYESQATATAGRFWSKVICDLATGCWLWTAAHSNGYGRFYLDGHLRPAHRVAYRLVTGTEPDEIDHVCRNHPCVRPDPNHCESVTHRENLRRGMGWSGRNARVTHCPQGHEYTAENTRRDKDGNRGCRTCERQQSWQRYQRKSDGWRIVHICEAGERNCMSLNRCTVIGNVGKDPEMKYTQSGTAVTTLSVAANRSWKDKNDEWQQEAEWFRVVCWSDLAERTAEKIRKGNKVYVEGRIQTRSWEDASGQKRFATELVANQVTSLERREQERDDEPPRRQDRSKPADDFSDLPF